MPPNNAPHNALRKAVARGVAEGGSITAITETLAQRIERLRPFIDSTRYALTEDDVRHDYQTGKHRYA